MRNNKLICIAATLFFVAHCRSGTGPSVDADTNAPAAKFYCVGGEGVLNPGRFVYHEGITITNAIRLAGGFSMRAGTNQVELIRNGQNRALDVDVSKIETGQATNVTIKPDDYVYVPGPRVLRLLRDLSGP